MPMRTYVLAMRDGSRKTRKAHVVRFAHDGHPPVEVALYRTPDGYAADHPRSGTALPVFDQTGTRADPVSLAEAKASLLMMLDEMEGYESLLEACGRLPVLNPGFC